MRSRASLIALVMVGLSLACATAPPPSPSLTPQQQRTLRLLAEIDLPQFAEKLEEVALRRAGHPRDGELPEDQRLRARIETQLAPDAVVTDVARRVAESFNEEFVAELERFSASELGGKAREAADTPYSWWSRFGYRVFGGFSADAPERVALIEKLDSLTQSSQTTAEVWMKVFASIVRWYEAKGFIDPNESEAVGGVDTLLTRERELVDAVRQRHTIPFGLYAHSDLSTPELSAYVAHAGSPASQWFSQATRDALLATIGERAEAIAR
jgi:hypothetical protein